MPERIYNSAKPLIYILESPSAADVYWGRSEGQLITSVLDLIRFNYLVRNVTDVQMFEYALAEGLQKDCDRLGKTPLILHLSCHGNKDGIELTSGQVISWGHLRRLVAPLNKEGNLLLCMSSCEGFSAIRMCFALDPPPFFGVVGNTGEVSWAEGAIAYAVFYHQLELGRNPLEAINAARIASGNDGFEVDHGPTAQQTFERELYHVLKGAAARGETPLGQPLPAAPGPISSE